jgi:hypothetical protein
MAPAAVERLYAILDQRKDSRIGEPEKKLAAREARLGALEATFAKPGKRGGGPAAVDPSRRFRASSQTKIRKRPIQTKEE